MLRIHTGKDVLVNYIDRTVPYQEMGFGISYNGTLFQHPYIASPIDEYSCESYYVRVEPFYNVVSLKSKIEMERPQIWTDVIKWAIPVCQAMIYLNKEMNYAYCQMNTTNIRLQKNGLPILFDLSLAIPLGSQVKGGFLLGNEMPPELNLDNCIAEPTIDIYSLGRCMYYALTGTHNNQKDISDKFSSVNGFVVNSIPKRFNSIIAKCLETNKMKRYQNFRELMADLERISTSDLDESILSFIKKKFRKN